MRDSYRIPHDFDDLEEERPEPRPPTPGATSLVQKRYANLQPNPTPPNLSLAEAWANGDAHRAAVQRKASAPDPLDMFAAQRAVQRKAAIDPMDAPKQDSIREERATIEDEPGTAAAPPTAEDSMPAAHDVAPAHADDGITTDMDAPKEASIREERATIEDQHGEAASAAGPLPPAKAAHAARKNRRWATRLRLTPAAFATSADMATPAFAQAVATFQSAHGLTVNGIAGPKTAAAVHAESGNAADHGASANEPAQSTAGATAAPHRASLLQMKLTGAPNTNADIPSIATAGVRGGGQPLPHLDRIQAAFGPHDVTGIRAHIGGQAADAATAIGAQAYATGTDVAFRSSPDLHTAAHEAAHVVQQRAGVHLKGGVGEAGDTYEQHADAVADAVVRGESAATLLGAATATVGTHSVQRRETEHSSAASSSLGTNQDCDGEESSPGDGVDPILVTSPRILRFPRVQVGESARGYITVANADVRRLVLEDVAPTTQDPFGDFMLENPGSLELDPAQEAWLTFRFHPSRAGHVRQTFRIETNAGKVGPEAQFTLTGDGFDGDDTFGIPSTKTRVGQQDQRAASVNGGRTFDPLRAKREQIEKDIHNWARKAKAGNAHFASWNRRNWTDFLGKTGGSHTLYESDKVIGVIKSIMTFGLAKIVEVENPIAGFFIERLIDVFVDFYAEALSGEKEKPSFDEVALTATEGVAEQSNQKADDFDARRAMADLAVDDAASGALLRVAESNTPEVLSKWSIWAQDQLAVVAMRPVLQSGALSDALLAEWLLQRAASPDHANRRTNHAAWDKAKKSGVLPTLKRNDLFVHQCMYEWHTLALAEAPQMIEMVEKKRAQLERDGRIQGYPPATIARMIANALSGDQDQPIHFTRSTNPKQTIDLFAEKNVSIRDKKTAAHYHKPFWLLCWLELETDGEGVYVKRFWYASAALDLSRESRSP